MSLYTPDHVIWLSSPPFHRPNDAEGSALGNSKYEPNRVDIPAPPNRSHEATQVAGPGDSADDYPKTWRVEKVFHDLDLIRKEAKLKDEELEQLRRKSARDYADIKTINQLGRELARKDKEIDDLLHEAKSKDDQLNRLRLEVRVKKDEAEQLHRETLELLEDLRTQADRKDREIHSLNTELECVRSQLDTRNDDVRALGQKVDHLQEEEDFRLLELAQLRHEASQKHAELKDARKDLEIAREQLAAQEKSVAEMKPQVQHVASMAARLRHLSADLAYAKVQVSSREKKLETMRQKIQAVLRQGDDVDRQQRQQLQPSIATTAWDNLYGPAVADETDAEVAFLFLPRWKSFTSERRKDVLQVLRTIQNAIGDGTELTDPFTANTVAIEDTIPSPPTAGSSAEQEVEEEERMGSTNQPSPGLTENPPPQQQAALESNHYEDDGFGAWSPLSSATLDHADASACSISSPRENIPNPGSKFDVVDEHEPEHENEKKDNEDMLDDCPWSPILAGEESSTHQQDPHRRASSSCSEEDEEEEGEVRFGDVFDYLVEDKDDDTGGDDMRGAIQRIPGLRKRKRTITAEDNPRPSEQEGKDFAGGEDKWIEMMRSRVASPLGWNSDCLGWHSEDVEEEGEEEGKIRSPSRPPAKRRHYGPVEPSMLSGDWDAEEDDHPDTLDNNRPYTAPPSDHASQFLAAAPAQFAGLPPPPPPPPRPPFVEVSYTGCNKLVAPELDYFSDDDDDDDDERKNKMEIDPFIKREMTPRRNEIRGGGPAPVSFIFGNTGSGSGYTRGNDRNTGLNHLPPILWGPEIRRNWNNVTPLGDGNRYYHH
ncbi:hypothetical protein B0H63DRAFT_558848 [Podospora didyma]|uniref:Uncharacterized protein n=1 Tax=Podospora didyma TaxID=330526 RepID=A0AAE0NTA7_9PEZI|nr:hypothetical protein B0H63DRAFT_558848 [Podospora didyma]